MKVHAESSLLTVVFCLQLIAAGADHSTFILGLLNEQTEEGNFRLDIYEHLDKLETDYAAMFPMKYDARYVPSPNPYGSIRAVCSMMSEGCSAIIGSVTCNTALALQSWSRIHHIPIILFPTQLCPAVEPADQFSAVIHTDASEIFRPTLQMLRLLRMNKVTLVLEDSNYQSLELGKLLRYSDIEESTFLVYPMSEAKAILQSSDQYTEEYILMGSQSSCINFIHDSIRENSKLSFLKIKFTWVIACEGLQPKDLKMPAGTMANMYLISPTRKQKQENHVRHMGENVTSSIVKAYDSVRGQISLVAAGGGGASCFNQSYWEDGDQLMAAISTQLTHEQHFGLIQTNIFHIFSFQIETNSWKDIGKWDRADGFDESVGRKILRKNEFNVDHLRIVTVIEKPFVWVEHTPDDKPVYRGYCMDLLDSVMERLNRLREREGRPPVTWEIHNVSQYGSLVDGRWTGAVGHVVYGKADVAVSGMIITSARSDVVDFTSRFMDYSVGIIVRRKENLDDGFGFLDPLDINVWVCFLVLVFAVGLLMYVLTTISPRAKKMNQLSGYTDISKFNCRNSIWFMISSIMMQGVDIQPSTPSGRIIGSFWWFFSLTVTAMYMANLAAFLTVNRMSMPVDSLQSLAYQSKIKYGTVKDSPVHLDFVEQSDMIPLYERIAATLTAASVDQSESQALVETAEEGYARVAQGDYAFMWDDPILQWMTAIHCEYMTVGKPFMNKGYGIAVAKGSPLKEDISSAILKLQEEAVLDKLKSTHFLNASTECVTGGNSQDDDNVDSKGIELENVHGIFLVLTFGSFLSFAVVFLEIWFNRVFGKTKQKEKRREIRTEIKPTPLSFENSRLYITTAPYAARPLVCQDGPQLSPIIPHYDFSRAPPPPPMSQPMRKRHFEQPSFYQRSGIRVQEEEPWRRRINTDESFFGGPDVRNHRLRAPSYSSYENDLSGSANSTSFNAANNNERGTSKSQEIFLRDQPPSRDSNSVSRENLQSKLIFYNI